MKHRAPRPWSRRPGTLATAAVLAAGVAVAVAAASAATVARPPGPARAAAAIGPAPGLARLVSGLSPDQLAGQRVIYSYRGLTPPPALLALIRQGEVAGIIFFTQNIGSVAHLAAVAQELQQANDALPNPVHEPLLL
ncbi:MAG: hypothetical protein ACHP9Z_10535, partial [Streptosporangiales bacterium]